MSGRVSTFSGSMQMDYMIQSMQTQMNQLMGEVSSGQVADPAQTMGTNAALLYQLQTQSNQQTALETSVTTAGQQMDTIQTALTGVGDELQTVISAAQEWSSDTGEGYGVLGSQASSTMSQILGQLNTSYGGTAVFAGDSGTAQPMQDAGAANGPVAAINTVLANAVSANGGPLTAADVSSLLTGPDGLASIFSDTNSNPALNYSSAFYTGSTDGQPTTVLLSPGQTVSYNASANQQPFRDMMQGLSMLSLLSAPSTQLDDTAKSAILAAATTQLNTAQQEMTDLQGGLGATQAQLTAAATTQQNAASATQAQILTYVQADTTADSTTLNTLQTQLQAAYEVTAQISQLSLVHYMTGLTQP